MELKPLLCDRCGAPLLGSGEPGVLVCDSCGTRFSVNKGANARISERLDKLTVATQELATELRSSGAAIIPISTPPDPEEVPDIEEVDDQVEEPMRILGFNGIALVKVLGAFGGCAAIMLRITAAPGSMSDAGTAFALVVGVVLAAYGMLSLLELTGGRPEKPLAKEIRDEELGGIEIVERRPPTERE